MLTVCSVVISRTVPETEKMTEKKKLKAECISTMKVFSMNLKSFLFACAFRMSFLTVFMCFFVPVWHTCYVFVIFSALNLT